MLDIDQVKFSFLQWLVNEDQARQDRYAMYREYYDGDHDTQLTERQRRYLQIKSGQEFNVNYCPIVVDALAERLEVTGFDAGGQGEDLWQWWQDNRMDGAQNVVHTSAVRDGDTYLIVEWDNEKSQPVFTHELAYDGAEGVKVHYSKEKRNRIMFASKRWRTEGENGADAGYVRRMNLYYPDRIEKYASDQRVFEGAWQPYQDEGETEWPIPWVDSAGQPLGVPVMHFKNLEQGYNYGVSELKNVIPIQNALNKSVIDLLAAADTTSFRIYYMIGDDPSGISIVPGSWVYTLRPPGGENGATIGAIDGEDIKPLINLKDSFTIEIAQVSRTPVSYFQVSGHRPAEGTMKQEEAGLVSKAKNRHVSFGNAWENAMILARRLRNTFGVQAMGQTLDEAQRIETIWRDPQTRNEKEHIETISTKIEKLRIPLERAWREAGYDEQTIAEMMDSPEIQARLNMLSIGLSGGDG